MRVVAILQARLGSTRLPDKSVMLLGGKPMAQNVYERVSRATKLYETVLAVPSSDAPVFRELGMCVEDYNGDENDLVGRYRTVAEWWDADIVVRVPADNPCVDPEYIDQAIDSYVTELHPFYSNTTAWCGARYVDGIGCEVISMSRLKWLDQRTQGHADWREHPHQWFVDSGVIRYPVADVRLDVNTFSDYAFIKSIYDHFSHNRFTTAEVLDYLYATQPR